MRRCTRSLIGSSFENTRLGTFERDLKPIFMLHSARNTQNFDHSWVDEVEQI